MASLAPLLLSILAGLAADRQDPPPPPEPSPERVKTALERLGQAFREGQPGERLRAIQEAASLADPEVIRAIANGIADEETTVRLASLEALRFQRHPAALEELHAAFRKNRVPEKEDKERAELILAIGQHASPSSLDLLSGGSLDSLHEHSTRARILALGRIRTPRSAAELMSLMNKAGRGPHGQQQFRGDFRLALWALTGTDEGVGIEGWQRWWNDHKQSLDLPDRPPEKPRELALRWRLTWMSPAELEAARKRERSDRGSRDGE